MHWDDVRTALYPDTADLEDFSYERVARLRRLIAGSAASSFAGREGVVEEWSSRVQPHSPGLASRLWYGGASMKSAQWAGERGMNFLTSSVIKAESSTDFAAEQAAQVRAFTAANPAGRVSQGLVVIPTDSASPSQVERYRAYVEARTPRTLSPQGPARLMFAGDLIGTSEEIAEQLYAHAGFRQVSEVVFALPFSFEHEDYVQILTDMAQHLGPALGWQPTT
jgi:alkanesulfonate monooxygenase SsuD/methylene tetrahydromethanopterin reductase-like flavin-dependent oxidoreductase (luciferase family)